MTADTTAMLLQNAVILDACSLISLYATGHFEPVLQCISGQVYLASYVERVEIKQLFNPATGDFDIPIDLTRVKSNGLLLITKPREGAEALDAVNFASAMSTKTPGKNTGEAITGAVAKSRNWTMVTDDVAATDFLAKQGLANRLTTTLHVIKFWSQSDNPACGDVQQALDNVRLYARYGPPPQNHPLLSWWLGFQVNA